MIQVGAKVRIKATDKVLSEVPSYVGKEGKVVDEWRGKKFKGSYEPYIWEVSIQGFPNCCFSDDELEVIE